MFIIGLHTGILESGILITKITEIGSSNIETIAELIDLNLTLRHLDHIDLMPLISPNKNHFKRKKTNKKLYTNSMCRYQEKNLKSMYNCQMIF